MNVYSPPASVSAPAGIERARANAHSRVRDRAQSYAVAAALLAIAALGTVLRLWDLGAPSLWYDEIFGLALAQQPLPVVLDVIGGFVANMALYLLLMHVWMALIDPSVSDALPRLPSVVFGVAGIGAIYLLGADLFGRRSGLVAALLLSVSPYHIGWSQDARSYTMWTLLVTLSFWALIRATRAPGKWEWWGAYALLGALAFYSHFFTIFVLLAQGLWVLSRMRRAEIVAFAGASVLLGVCLAPLIPFATSNTDGSQLRHLSLPDGKDIRLLARAYAGGEWAQWAFAALLGLGSLVLLAGRRQAQAGRSVWLLLLLWLLVTPLLVIGLSYVYKPLFRERYVFVVLPAACLLAAAAFARGRSALLGAPVLAALVALSVMAAVNGFSVRRDEDWRSAVSYLAAQAQPEDGFIFISRRNHLPWQYYAPRFGKDPMAIHDVEPFDWHELARSRTYRAPAFSRGDLDRFSSSRQRIWLVLSHEFDAFEHRDEGGDTSAWVRERLTRTGFSARQRVFPSVRVLLYEKRRA